MFSDAGRLIKANRLMLWLWKPKLASSVRSLDVFRHETVFHILERNLSRLPTLKNTDFYRAKFPLLHLFFGDGPTAPFFRKRKGNKSLQNLYREVAAIPPAKSWTYTINLTHPDTGGILLEFVAVVSSVTVNDQLVAYIASYTPIGYAEEIVRRAYSKLFDISGIIPFVIDYDDGEDQSLNLREKEFDSKYIDVPKEVRELIDPPEMLILDSDPFQETWDRLNAALDEEAMRLHPERPIDEVSRDYPEQWIASISVRVADLGEKREFTRLVRVFEADSDYWALKDKIKRLEPDYPGVSFTAEFTGSAQFGPNCPGAVRPWSA